MRNFSYFRASSHEQAVSLFKQFQPGAKYLCGGTTQFDLMKLGVESPTALIDLTGIGGLNDIKVNEKNELQIGAFATMADVAESQIVKDEFPALSESLWKAASQQIRNMASVGANILQRTRCGYFRSGSGYACNKRNPGSGCSALEGVNRSHALFGGSELCVAVYPGDWANALIAFDAVVDTVGKDGGRTIPIEQLHTLPGVAPHLESVLADGEIIVAIRVPRSAVTVASTYHKIRDRESYAFALTSAAVGVHIVANHVRDVRIALGGVATKPWRAKQAEAGLIGLPLTRASAHRAAEIAFRDAIPLEHNRFKIALGIETVTDALMIAKSRSDHA